MSEEFIWDHNWDKLQKRLDVLKKKHKIIRQELEAEEAKEIMNGEAKAEE